MGQLSKKTILLAVAVIILMVIMLKIAIFSSPANKTSDPLVTGSAPVQINPSETFKVYSDPSGFTFDYPDNLSLTKNDLTDATFADLQLSAKGVEGSLILKVTDSKFLSAESWAKSIKDIEGQPKEVKLGNLRALEVKTASGIKLASIDQGVIFSIDVSQNDFWMKVYNKVLADFSFAPPAQDNTSLSGTSDDVSFEGEEVVE